MSTLNQKAVCEEFWNPTLLEKDSRVFTSDCSADVLSNLK